MAAWSSSTHQMSFFTWSGLGYHSSIDIYIISAILGILEAVDKAEGTVRKFFIEEEARGAPTREGVLY